MWICILQQKTMQEGDAVLERCEEGLLGYATVKYIGTISPIVVQNFPFNCLLMVRPLAL